MLSQSVHHRKLPCTPLAHWPVLHKLSSAWLGSAQPRQHLGATVAPEQWQQRQFPSLLPPFPPHLNPPTWPSQRSPWIASGTQTDSWGMGRNRIWGGCLIASSSSEEHWRQGPLPLKEWRKKRLGFNTEGNVLKCMDRYWLKFRNRKERHYQPLLNSLTLFLLIYLYGHSRKTLFF